MYVAGSGKTGYCGFRITNHGESNLCAAVSMLGINTVNSLEMLTGCGLEYCYDPKGGYIECLLTGEEDAEAELLLRSLALGLDSVKRTYGGSEISIGAAEKSPGYKLTYKKNSIKYTR